MAKNSKAPLDFLVIGTTKGGTTTLFEWLRHHPNIFIPKGKEVPFFSNDEEYTLGLAHYLKTHFADAQSTQIRGTVSPQYMWGQDAVTVEEVADRIKRDTPNVKLIAILRDPIERAYSHHKMYVRWQVETRTFEEAMHELLQEKSLKEARSTTYTGNALKQGLSGPNNYIVASEYGRALKAYYERFPADQIKIYFSNELRDNRSEVLRDILEFLEIDASFQPSNLFTDYHQGGSKARVSWLGADAADRIPVIGPLWKQLPRSFRQRTAIAIHRWNVKPDKKTADKQSSVYEQLREHFAKDTQLLEELIGRKAPWSKSVETE